MTPGVQMRCTSLAHHHWKSSTFCYFWSLKKAYTLYSGHWKTGTASILFIIVICALQNNGGGGIIAAAKELLAEAANASRSADASTRRTSQ